MFLVIIFIIALFAIIFPKKVVMFWVKVYEAILALSMEKKGILKKIIIFLGAVLLLVSFYLLVQNFQNIDRGGVYILMLISGSLILFSNYFSNSLINYSKITLRLYKEKENQLILVTRIFSIVCVVVVMYLRVINS